MVGTKLRRVQFKLICWNYLLIFFACTNYDIITEAQKNLSFFRINNVSEKFTYLSLQQLYFLAKFKITHMYLEHTNIENNIYNRILH